jgi:hypothetical protein
VGKPSGRRLRRTSRSTSATSSVYLGGFTFAELFRAGLVDELAEGALGRAAALFRTDRAPWCPEIF